MGNGNGKRRRSPRKRLLTPEDEKLLLDQDKGQAQSGVYHLVNLDSGYIGVMDGEKKVTGYVVPKHIAALYYRFWSIAPALQEKYNFPDPTKDQFEEIMKRYCNGLGAAHEDILRDAVVSVMNDPDWKPDESWDPDKPNKFVKGYGVITGISEYEEKDSDDTDNGDDGEEETNL